MSFDLEDAQADLKKLLTKYEEIRYGITAKSERMNEAIARLRREFKATKRDLNSASKIISPPFTKTGRAVINHPTHSTALQVSGKNTDRQQFGLSPYSGGPAVLVGAGTGTVVAIAAWSAVQVVGVASTGAAIGGLSGAAAANAGWAAFGGGSLAVGGGGMAAGMLVLPGIGLLAGVATAAFMTHKELKRVRGACDEVRGVNEQNGLVLNKLNVQTERLETSERLFVQAHVELAKVIGKTKKKLFRFGWFSQIWRLICHYTVGSYYSADEMASVASLDKAIADFMAKFGNR